MATDTPEKPAPTGQYGLTLSGEALANARWLAREGGISTVEAVRRALAVLRFLREQELEGTNLKLHTRAGDVERVHIVFT